MRTPPLCRALPRARVAMTAMPIAEISPSGINALPLIEQAGVFALGFVAIGIGTLLLTAVLGQVERTLPDGWFAKWRGTWPLLGIVYMAAGVSHFTLHGAFEAIYPPPGTWGIWYLPGSPEFHVAWTGVAELAGGAGLLVGSIAEALSVRQLRWLKPTAAAALIALTLAVTPANLYMYTHGAQMVGLPGAPDGAIPVAGHYARAVAQSVLLAFLAGMAREGQAEKSEQ